MRQQDFRGVCAWVLAVLLTICLTPALGWAQASQGRVNVAVADQQGAVVTDAELKLVDLATNDTRKATTQEAGTFSFVNLSYGQYELTITKQGFETQTYTVIVQTGRDTDVKAILKVGATAQTVTVEGGIAPLVESTANAVNNTIDLKQIEDLPLGGRNIAQLAQLGAGYNGAFNGLPIMAQGSTVDGVIGNTNRWKYGSTGTGGSSSSITPRLENIAEMTVSTDQLDLNSGWGTSTMQITYVTRRGTNQWHGRVFEDHRSSALNAYSWGSDQKSKFHLNEFGGSVGGPVFKDKLFFFVNFSMFKQPGGSSTTRQFFRDPAKTGVFTYGPAASPITVNLFNVIAAYNTANGTSFPTTVNSAVAARIAQVDTWRTSSGAVVPTSSAPSDPNVNAWTFQYQRPQTIYYPTFRIDYQLSQSKRFNFAVNQTNNLPLNSYSDHWPGDGRGAQTKGIALTAALGFEWTISPTVINQAKFGYNYSANWFGINGPQNFHDPGTNVIWYGYAGGTGNGNLDDWYEYPNSRAQPVFSLSDNVSWAKGAHMFSFGFNAYRDQNKYWDPEEGFTQITLGLNSSDPAAAALSKALIQARSSNPSVTMTDTEWGNARQLYATLAGRVSQYYGRHAYVPGTGAFSPGVDRVKLNELQKSYGIFFQDSWKIKPNLTVNYGMRWDFIPPNTDLTKKYMTLADQDLWGPTTIGAIFKPGTSTLTGTMNPQWVVTPTAYDGFYNTPQPAIGIAWTPRSDGNLFERLLGGEKTVIRAAYNIRRFTNPQQFIWDFGTNYGTGFYQRFYSYPGSTDSPGFFVYGSKVLTDPVPTNLLSFAPPTYSSSIPVSASTFGSLTVNAIKDGIRQPYTQQFNIGFQRDLGSSRALEVRYHFNHTIHQWIAPNFNEVNIFENGFLTEFKNARSNLDICLANQTACKAAAGVTSSGTYSSFRNWGLAGQVAVPLMAAVGGSSPNSFYTNTTYVNRLLNGQAGSFANGIQTNKDYFCRMVGTAFSPCGTSYGAGAGYPINYFVVNPFAAPASAQMLTDDGYSNYNALQVEFRQRYWHGVTVNANYTWSRTLGIMPTDWYAAFSQYTLRDLRTSYGPLNGDRNHVIHISSTYDLPFGKGKPFANLGGVVNKVLGGWTISTIFTFQSGSAYRIGGNNNTFNNSRDGGLNLNGVTKDDFMSHQGLWFDSAGRPQFLDPSWVAQIKGANMVTAFNTPGEWGTNLYLHGPHQTYTDVGISKNIQFSERFRFKFQTEMTNAFNHPTFGQSNTGITDTAFGRGSQTATSRRIEFRANLEF